MRIERVRIDSFGRLRDLDTGPDALPGLVVVLGPNEAGKSTLFHFLTSMLYGFQPATRERNPYAPWDGQDPSGAVSLALDGGGCVGVERRLLSQPSARMTTDEGVQDLRNRPLPWVAHIPRAVFRQVYALTLGELAGLDGETWSQVQDRLIGSMGSSDLRLVRHVVAELEQEAGELWRPTRRGNQRIRALQEELLGLRARRRDALQNDQRLRHVVREIAETRHRLQDLRETRQQARVTIRRIEELAPVRRQLQRIEALEAEAGDVRELDGLPHDPARTLRELGERRSALGARSAELEAARAEPAEAAAAVGEEEERLLASAEAVASLSAKVVGLATERARLAGVEQEIRDLDRRLEAAAGQVLAVVDAEAVRKLASLPLQQLRDRMRRLEAAAEELRISEAARDRHPRGGSGDAALLVAASVALAAGLVILGFGLVDGNAAVIAAGVVGTALGVVGLLVRSGASGRHGADEEEDDVTLRRLRRERGEAEASVRGVFGDLKILGPDRTPWDGGLVSAVERVQELARDRSERVRATEALAARLKQADETASRLAPLAGVGADTDAESIAMRLERQVRRAERLQEAAVAAHRELARLEREDDRLRTETEEAEAALAGLRSRILATGAPDTPEGCAALGRRLEARDHAERLREELRRSHADLEAVAERIRRAEEAGDTWTLQDDALAAQRAREEELSEEVERLVARVEALERDAAYLREGDSADAIDGEMTALQQTETTLLAERDRRWVLAQLLREADQRFREAHQPDLMRRAGAHLARLTGERYTRIVVDEGADDGSFLLVGPDLPGPIPLAPPISTGTLEQAYLSLRLAIVDHLDQGLERLPLFVDELFVNWDERRRRQGLDILGALAEERQLFTFTCHPHVADELAAGGARVLELVSEG